MEDCDKVEIVQIGKRGIERGQMFRAIFTMGTESGLRCEVCGVNLSGMRYIVESVNVRYCLGCVEYILPEVED